MKANIYHRLVNAVADHVHVASEASAALTAVLAVVEDALTEAAERARADALAEAQDAVERDCADPSAALAVMALQ